MLLAESVRAVGRCGKTLPDPAIDRQSSGMTGAAHGRPAWPKAVGPCFAKRGDMNSLFSFAGASAGLAPFLDPLALAIVIGGTGFATCVRTPVADLRRAGRSVSRLWHRRFHADPAIAQIGALGRIARAHGVVRLDRSVIDDPDIAAAVAAIVDGAGPEPVRALVEERQLLRAEADLAAADTIAAIAETAPAIGMVGTLIGLVRLFTTMNDPNAIGGAMAVALLTTLYGAVLAGLVAAPVAGRLRRIARADAVERARLVEPLVALARQEAPRLRTAVAA